jgi:transposase
MTPEELAALVASDPRTAGATIVTAPMPPRLIERSFATPSLIAHVASDKFCDGLPLHLTAQELRHRWCLRAVRKSAR